MVCICMWASAISQPFLFLSRTARGLAPAARNPNRTPTADPRVLETWNLDDLGAEGTYL